MTSSTPDLYGPDDIMTDICRRCGHPRYEHATTPRYGIPPLTCLHGWGQHESQGIRGCACVSFR